jgi:hypothetical protein
MEYSSVQLDDLPDEILMIIFKKLNNITLLYSLIGANIRLNKIVCDSIFTNHLTLVNFAPSHFIMKASSPIYFAYPLPDPIVDRFCLHILPEIHQNIKWLDLESLSMERILLSTNYPNLSGIALYNIPIERAVHLFSGKIFDFDFFTDKYIIGICQMNSFESIYNYYQRDRFT